MPHDPPTSASAPSEKLISLPVVHDTPFGVHWLPANEPTESPKFDVTSREPAPLFKTILSTPAMASDPYCAAAPSRSTSMWSIAEIGIAFKSTLVDPRPMLLLTCTSALWCRRLLSTSTST